jgi:hypothetical protein
MILSNAPLRLAVLLLLALIDHPLLEWLLTIQFHRLLVIVERKIILENSKPLVKLQKHEFRSYRIFFTIILSSY